MFIQALYFEMETPFSAASTEHRKWELLLGHGIIFKKNRFGDIVPQKFNNWAIFFSILNGILAIVPYLCLSIYLQLTVFTFDQVLEAGKIVGIGLTDIVTLTVFILHNIMYYFAALIFIKANMGGMKMMGEQTGKIARKYELQEGLVKKYQTLQFRAKNAKRFRILIILEIFGIIFLCLFWYLMGLNTLKFCKIHDFSLEILIMIANISAVFLAPLILFPYPTMRLEIGMSTCLQFLTKSYENWAEFCQEKITSDNPDRIEEVLQYAHDLTDTCERFNNHFSTIRLIKHGHSLLSCTICGYGVCTILFRLTRPSIHILVSCLCFALQGSVFALRLMYIFDDGKALKESMQKSTNDFQDLLMENPILNRLDETQELKIKILINRLRNTKSIFHTLKLFESNGTSLACVISTILTYIVVLLQLKTIEIPLH